MSADVDMQRLKELAQKYCALTFAQEKAGEGDAWKDEYWAIVDRMLDNDQLRCPLDDAHLLDLDFWSTKYEAFVDAHRERHLSLTFKALRFLLRTALRPFAEKET